MFFLPASMLAIVPRALYVWCKQWSMELVRAPALGFIYLVLETVSFCLATR